MTPNTAGEYIFDITDYAVEEIKRGRKEFVLGLSDETWSGEVNMNTSVAPKLLIELETESFEEEIRSLQTADEIDAFLKNTVNADGVGIDINEYTKFVYPLAVAEEIKNIGFNSAETFKNAFDAAVEKYTEKNTFVMKHKVSYSEESNFITSKKILNINPETVNSSSSKYVTFHFEVPEFSGKIMKTKMTATQQSTSNTVKSSAINSYSITRPDSIPADGKYEEKKSFGSTSGDSQIVSAWLKYVEGNTFISDTGVTFKFNQLLEDGKTYSKISSAVEIPAAMFESIKTAAAANGSGYFVLKFVKGGDNLNFTNIDIVIETDLTETIYNEINRKNKLVEIINTAVEAESLDAESLLGVFEEYEDVLKLSENADYQKSDKLCISQAVIDNKPLYGYESFDAVKAAINAELALMYGSDMYIKRVTNSNGNVCVSVLKNKEADGATVIVAEYDSKGNFLSVKMQKSTELDNAEIGSSVDVTIPSGFSASSTVKGYIWDIDTLKPLAVNR